MKTIFIIFVTDAWNSNKQMIIVASTRKNGMKLLNTWIRKNHYDPLDQDDLENLERINQTQGRNVNFQIEPTEMNVIVG